MATTKTQNKEKLTGAVPAKEDELPVAYEIHTLAQILYGELSQTTPWAGAADYMQDWTAQGAVNWPVWPGSSACRW